MYSPIASLLCLQLFIGGAESFVGNSARTSAAKTALSAYNTPPSGGANGAWGSRGSGSGVPSKTACDSAMNVEWEPMSELDRRIEDGVHYEHIPNFYNQLNEEQHRMPGCHSKAKRMDDFDDAPGVRAIFCAYRYSDEEYNCLKSADLS